MSFKGDGWKRLFALLLGTFVGIGAAIFAGSGFTPEPATAHLDRWTPGHVGPYTSGSSNCSDRVDPIQVVYYGDATTPKVDGHSSHHDGWDVDDGTTGNQYFYDHGCSSMDGQNATESIYYSRYHQRHEDNNASDSYWRTYSLASPHYEDIVWCGHAVRENNSSSMPEGGFINAKHRIVAFWDNSHYHWGYQDWDNVDWMKQCDNAYAWGNGIVDFLRID